MTQAVGFPDWQSFPNQRALVAVAQVSVPASGSVVVGPFHSTNYQTLRLYANSAGSGTSVTVSETQSQGVSFITTTQTYNLGAGVQADLLIPLIGADFQVEFDNSALAAVNVNYVIELTNTPVELVTSALPGLYYGESNVNIVAGGMHQFSTARVLGGRMFFHVVWSSVSNLLSEGVQAMNPDGSVNLQYYSNDATVQGRNDVLYAPWQPIRLQFFNIDSVAHQVSWALIPLGN